MKTYLLKIPEILRGISNKLDIIATLCDKSWIVFNDEGVRILLIFQDDGTLIVSRNGNVSKQKWSYIKANSTILIEDTKQSFLLHPAFIDNVIFALKQDGTEHHLFMIDEKQQGELSTFTLQYLNQYFINKVKRIEEEEKNKMLIELQGQLLQQKLQQEEQERRKRKEELRKIEEAQERKRQAEEELKKKKKEQLLLELNKKEEEYGKWCGKNYLKFLFCFFVAAAFLVQLDMSDYFIDFGVATANLFGAIIFVLPLALIAVVFWLFNRKDKKRYQDEISDAYKKYKES